MSWIKLKDYALLFLLGIFAFLLRFVQQLPVIWLDDSVKYQVPLQIIQTANFDWVLSTLNFSVLTRIINYYLQSSSSGDPGTIIVFQKIIAVLATLVFFLIASRLTSNRYLAFIFALIFTIDPLMLFYESTIMPDTLFIFEGLLLLYLFICLIKNWNPLIAALYGLVLGLFALTKETGFLYLMMVSGFFVVYAFYALFRYKNYKILIATIVIFTVSFLTQLPLKLYTLKHYSSFDNSRYDTSGVVLWFLTEDMLVKNPTDLYPWLTNALLSLTQEQKQTFRVPLDQPHRYAFESAITKVNVAGREGQLVDPVTQLPLSSPQWAKIAKKYWFSTICKNPLRSLQSSMEIAQSLFWQENYGFWTHRKSARPYMLNEVPQYTMVPFSLKEQLDPKLHGKSAVELYDVETISSRIIPLMVNNNTNYAFLLEENSFALSLQKHLRDKPFVRLFVPLFVILFLYFVILYFRKKINLDILDCYFLYATSFFMTTPLIVHGEPRYRMQFMYLVLLSILLMFAKIFEKKS